MLSSDSMQALSSQSVREDDLLRRRKGSIHNGTQEYQYNADLGRVDICSLVTPSIGNINM